VDYQEATYEQIKADYLALADRLGLKNVDFIPVSALFGDNIVQHSNKLAWYDGATLLEYLESIDFVEDKPQPWRFPVQWVIRPQTDDLHDYRGYAGRVLGDGLKVGEEVLILPGGQRSHIKALEFDQKPLENGVDGQSLVIHLADDIDVSRGDVLVSASNPAHVERNFEATLCWFDQKPLSDNQTYYFQNHTAIHKVKITDMHYKYDVNTQEKNVCDTIQLNDIAKVSIKAANDVVFDLNQAISQNARGILIDPRTNLTMGAVLIDSI